MRNYVELIGRPGADPVVKTLESGQKFASMNFATSDDYYDKDKKEKIEVTDWHNVVAWRHVAESLSHVKKGKLLMVVGRIKTRKYTDKNGVEKWITEVLADEVYFLEKMGTATSGSSNNGNEQNSDYKKTGTGSKISME